MRMEIDQFLDAKAALKLANTIKTMFSIVFGGNTPEIVALNSPLARIAHVAVYGYKHKHVSITSVDATSRLPLYVISRILIDYITKQMNTEEEKAA